MKLLIIALVVPLARLVHSQATGLFLFLNFGVWWTDWRNSGPETQDPQPLSPILCPLRFLQQWHPGHASFYWCLYHSQAWYNNQERFSTVQVSITEQKSQKVPRYYKAATKSAGKDASTRHLEILTSQQTNTFFDSLANQRNIDLLGLVLQNVNTKEEHWLNISLPHTSADTKWMINNVNIHIKWWSVVPAWTARC
jgi:hypothetical protein